MALRTIVVIIMTVLLAATVMSADENGGGNSEGEQKPPEKTTEKPEGAPPENLQGNLKEKPGEEKPAKSDVDIAMFYDTGERIWILGLSTSQYPCMLDVVEETNETFTHFTRFHKEQKSFQWKDLLGKFTSKSTSANTYNAMDVSPARDNKRRQARTGSWKGLEIMLLESSDKNCALFSTTYSERPSNLPVTVQKDLRNARRKGTDAEAVQYDFRLKKSVGKPEEAQKCMQELVTQWRAQAQDQGAIEIPSTFLSCKQDCEKDPLCGAALEQEQAQPENPPQQQESTQNQPKS